MTPHFRKSKFIFLIPLSDGWRILYNTLNGAIMLIDTDLKNHLEKGNISAIPADILNNLIEEEFLVYQDLDELKYYQYLLNKAIYASDTLSSVILTTYDCNLACIYCYERQENVIKPIYMSIETAKDVAEYIERRAKTIRPKRLSIALYGGEPLLNIDAGITILERLKKYCSENNVKIGNGLITNGTLITREIIERLQEYNLASIQVSIDGTKEIHDKRRPFRDGRGSFDIIMKNISEIVDVLPPKTIVIRVNIDKMNYNNFPLFLDYLEDVGLKYKIKLGIGIPRGVFPYCTKMQFSEYEIADRVFNLWKTAIKRGFTYHIEPQPALCSALQENSQIIDPKGDIYKCWAFVGLKQYIVGSIYSNKYKPIYYAFLTKMQPIPVKCRNCNILPYCNGGCLYEAYYMTKDPFNIICGGTFSRDSLEKIVKLYVIERYRKILKEKGLWRKLVEDD